MRVLLARYRAAPGQGDAVEDALRSMTEAVARDEPGCLSYRVSRSTDDPDVFILHETYDSEQALLAHRETEHFRRVIEHTVVPMLRSREREILVPVDGFDR